MVKYFQVSFGWAARNLMIGAHPTNTQYIERWEKVSYPAEKGKTEDNRVSRLSEKGKTEDSRVKQNGSEMIPIITLWCVNENGNELPQ